MRSSIAVIGTMAVLAIAFSVAKCGEARGQDCREGDFGCGHMQNHEQYKTWRGNDGASCCNESECRPTRARQNDDGSWSAWVEGAWRRVPPRALLEPDRLKDGRSHVCSPAYNPDVIYCFSPAQPKG